MSDWHMFGVAVDPEACADCAADSPVYHFGLSWVHNYLESKKEWRICRMSSFLQKGMVRSDAVSDNPYDASAERSEAVVEVRMEFPEESFDFEGQTVPAKMLASGLIVPTAPVKAEEHPDPEPALPSPSASGIVIMSRAPEQIRKVRPTFAQGLELTRRPDKDGR